jgi:hypothetical protein
LNDSLNLTPCFCYDLTKPISQHFSYGLMRYPDHKES